MLLDHDVAAEIALQALGAERPACLVFLDRWRAAFGSGPGPAGVGSARAASGGSASMGAGSGGAGPGAGRPGGARLRSAAAAGVDLRSFGSELARVVELGRLVRAERRWADPELAASDRSRLLERFLAELRQATAVSLQGSSRARGRQQIVVQAHPLPSGEEAAAEVTTSPARIELQLHLPLAWVIDVGGRGLGNVDGRLVLSVTDTDQDRGLLGVSGIVWEVSGPGRVIARLERWWMGRVEGEWRPVDGVRAVRAGRPLWWSTTQR